MGGGWVWVCFFFNDTATTEIYTLSLHDALPISAYVFSGNGSYDSMLSNLAGVPGELAKPLVRIANDLYKGKGDKALSKALTTGTELIPWSNYPVGAYQFRAYVLNQRIREWLNPGYLSRMKARQARESAQNQSLFGD